MSAIVADTHAVVWQLCEPTELSAKAAEAMEQARLAGDPVLIPSICLVEIAYLVEKGRLPQLLLERLDTEIDHAESAYEVLPLSLEVARAIRRIPRELVPDMPDRIIAASALAVGAPLVTCDQRIQAAGVTVIW